MPLLGSARRAVAAIGAVLLAVAGLAACGMEQDPTGAGAAPPGTGTYWATGTVLESPKHGPQLCEILAMSYPPQCGGIDLVGFDWADVEGEESSGGTTWGSYTVTGTWDGERLTLTEPPAAPQRDPEVGTGPDRFSTPCPEPEGGWQVVDPAKASQGAFDQTAAAAGARADYAGLWIDQPIRGELNPENENDPTNLILNVRVTGEVEAAERDLREIWGGALCVTAAQHTEAELLAIQEELADRSAQIGLLSTGTDTIGGMVTLRVAFDDGTLQSEFDGRYGSGIVLVSSWLQPAQ